MSLPFSLLENLKVVQLFVGAPSTLGSAGVSDYICCKNAHKVWVLLQHFGTNDTDLAAIGIQAATDVAAGTSAAVTATLPIWYTAQASYLTTDAWTRATDAATYTPLDPALLGQTRVLLEWDPAKHTTGYDCIALRCTGGHASNFCVVNAFILPRFAQADVPSVIVD